MFFGPLGKYCKCSEMSGVVITESSYDDFIKKSHFINFLFDVIDDDSLVYKLKQVKYDLKFCGYLQCIISEVFKEAESLFVSIFYLLLFMVMLIVGLQHQFARRVECLADPLLAICLIESGILGGIINVINLSYFISGTRNSYIERCKNVFQLVLFINNVLGLCHIYSIWKPEAVDINSPHYCQFNLYWVAFFTFHCSSIIYVIMLLLLLFSILYYFA
ncbi:hypothetical protein TNCT_416781 [Trichonephila clavata]|uniref:Uncharacterized protein n=1 Tax=Trichonephila clavata TaxID=2740835 RepID=A0A8X6K986_TRICU|nr:hypothetical protein TNCT_416781 [Trichonephila clavata]